MPILIFDLDRGCVSHVQVCSEGNPLGRKSAKISISLMHTGEAMQRYHCNYVSHPPSHQAVGMPYLLCQSRLSPQAIFASSFS